MQSPRHSTQFFLLHFARIVVAVMLVCALLAGVAPTGSLSLAAASECSMSCCAGLPPHPAGECESVVSCHVKLPKQIEASDAPTAEHVPNMAASSHDAHDDNGESHAPPAHHHAAESQTATDDASHDAPAETDQAPTRTATESTATHASTQLPPSQQTSPQSGAKPLRRRASVARPALANPCPPDCGMAASGFINVQRSRDAATLTSAHRPRPPTGVVARTHASGFPLDFSAGKYRLAPPRAPPVALNSTPA